MTLINVQKKKKITTHSEYSYGNPRGKLTGIPAESPLMSEQCHCIINYIITHARRRPRASYARRKSRHNKKAAAFFHTRILTRRRQIDFK